MAFEKKIWTNNGMVTEEVPVPPAISADNLNRIEEGIDGALQKDGGIMTGGLILRDVFNDDKEAVSKKYVDKNTKVISLNSVLQSWENPDTSAGKIPNFDVSKYVVWVITNNVSASSGARTQIIPISLDTWNDVSGTIHTYDNHCQIKINLNGEIFFRNGKSSYAPDYLLLLPMEFITLE